MSFNKFSYLSFVRFASVVVGMVWVAFMSSQSVGTAWGAPRLPNLQQDAHQKIVQTAPDQIHGVFVGCHPEGVAAYAERIHVKCTEVYDGVNFFALSTVDSRHASRVLSVLLTAQAIGKTLNILYEPSDTSGSNFGCFVENCRVILAVQMAG